MTKLTGVLLYRKPLKKFTNYRPEPAYKQILPQELKDSVSAKGEKGKVAPCLQEMSLMLACMKESDFSEMRCAKEVQAFNSCVQEHMASMRKAAHAASSGDMRPSKGGRLNTKQLNELLGKFPQPK